jgi:outer membrane biosynthesis protein TonB
MPLIQIPSLQSPPPPQHLPDQGDLFDATHWESAYRQMHDFPTLLIQAQDDLARARKREAFWMSLVAHILLIIVIVNSPKFEKYLPKRAVMMVRTSRDNTPLTFLEAPPDTQKAPRPDTGKMSDKNRIATSRQPQLNREELKKLLDASRAGRPGPTAPPAQQQSAPQQSAAQSTPPQPQSAPQPAPPPAQMAKLQSPPVTQKPTFSNPSMSAEKAIEQAARAAAITRGTYAGDNGDLGLGQRQSAARMGPMEITTDTQGVDFGPYLQRVLHDVKRNWYNLIPESAMAPLLKKGKLSIEFAIKKDGQIAGMRYVSGSGDVALDRAAYGGITASNPFPPLPGEFGGQYLGLRFTFFYNPDKDEADLK